MNDINQYYNDLFGNQIEARILEHDRGYGGYRYKLEVTVAFDQKFWNTTKRKGEIGTICSLDLGNYLHRAIGFKYTYNPTVDTKARAKNGITHVRVTFFFSDDEHAKELGFTRGQYSTAVKVPLLDAHGQPVQEIKGDRIKARVKWYDDAKGYGFLEANGADIFAHYSAIEAKGFKTLVEGEEVECELVDGAKGPQAVKITRGAVQ